jgi:hypothetical protein
MDTNLSKMCEEGYVESNETRATSNDLLSDSRERDSMIRKESARKNARLSGRKSRRGEYPKMSSKGCSPSTSKPTLFAPKYISSGIRTSWRRASEQSSEGSEAGFNRIMSCGFPARIFNFSNSSSV